MVTLVRKLDRRVINTAFGMVYGFALLMALFPPLYLAASGSTAAFLGIPWAIFYWIVNAALVGLALTALYVVEQIRGEGDD
ncbi:hypothetical protein QE410_000119 [Microbacterium sp. SORGH_AS 1204]|uniref:hypothetical protein n=1 Tax=Microbacterium sp. SORGH_AS_1204 TaxID=3041785 RepID=UPI002792A4EE|nr:hypothetical protein [Microbacterium sp. SORGH_AS_1204]MDQ1135320.1 hypothetical protein [Microbacterium sp. SORGH_AS_1204]